MEKNLNLNLEWKRTYMGIGKALKMHLFSEGEGIDSKGIGIDSKESANSQDVSLLGALTMKESKK